MNRPINAESRGGTGCIADVGGTIGVSVVVIKTTPLGFVVLTILG